MVNKNHAARTSSTFLYPVTCLLLSSCTPTYLTRHQTCSRFQNQWGSGPSSHDWTDQSCGGTWRCGCSTAAWLFLERWGLQDPSQRQSRHSEYSRAVAQDWGSRCSGGRWARRSLTLPEWSFLKKQRERGNSIIVKLNWLSDYREGQGGLDTQPGQMYAKLKPDIFNLTTVLFTRVHYPKQLLHKHFIYIHHIFINTSFIYDWLPC